MRRLAAIWLNVTFYPAALLYSAIVIPALAAGVAVASLVVSRRRAMRMFRRAINWYGWGIIHGVAFPCVRVTYRRPAPDPGAGACVFVSNHRSGSDAFFMAVLREEMVQVVNIWPFRIPVLGFAARMAGYLSVREMPIDDFIARGRALLREGVSIVVFPEGTRSGGRELGSFHGAAFRLALAAGVPIVPLCVAGTERTPARGTAWLEPARIRIHRLPAVPWASFRDLDAFHLKTRIRKMMAAELAAMDGVRA
jgi:1-acyl-sn-glycerol-3-phosphate acyltransferase